MYGLGAWTPPKPTVIGGAAGRTASGGAFDSNALRITGLTPPVLKAAPVPKVPVSTPKPAMPTTPAPSTPTGGTQQPWWDAAAPTPVLTASPVTTAQAPYTPVAVDSDTGEPAAVQEAGMFSFTGSPLPLILLGIAGVVTLAMFHDRKRR